MVELAATLEAGIGTAHGADSSDGLSAMGATIEKFPLKAFSFEGEIVATRFVSDSEVSTSSPPCRAVWWNAAFASAVLCEEVGEFVEEGAFDLFGGEFFEGGVERDGSRAPSGKTCRSF